MPGSPINQDVQPDSSDVPKTEWVLRFKEGDETVFGEILRRYEKPVINLAYKFLGNREEAENAAQETFLEVYRRAGSYQPTGKFSSWIFTIAAHICLNLKRRKARVSEISLDGTVDSPGGAVKNEISESPGHGPSRVLERAELQSAVRKALLALPGSQRLVVILAKFEGMPLGEISQVLGISSGAVKQLLHRAKNSLKDQLRLHKQSLL